MTPAQAYPLIVIPGLQYLGDPYQSAEAQLMLMAIGITESGFRTRLQQPKDYAHGFWQFEKQGGCAGFEVDRKQAAFRATAKTLYFPTTRTDTWTLLGKGADSLALIMARGLLWSDPAPLPAPGEEKVAYEYYRRCWRPGKPSWTRWQTAYGAAMDICGLTAVSP